MSETSSTHLTRAKEAIISQFTMPAPIVSATLQATTLSAISNVLAQLLDGYRKDVSCCADSPTSPSSPALHIKANSENPQLGLTFSPSDFLRFLIVTLLTAPPNFLWQNLLERWFPGRAQTQDHDILLAERGGPPSSSATNFGGGSGLLDPLEGDAADYEDDGDGKRRFLRGADMHGNAEGTSLNWRNTMLKWFIDCITLGAIFNTIAFLLLMGLLKAKTMADIMETVRLETWPIIWAGYKMWPIASIVSFSLIPVEKRIVFLSGVGLIWGVYLSLVAAEV